MRSFTLAELASKSGEVVEAAVSGPVEITSRGKSKFVLLTAEAFDRLQGSVAQRKHRSDRLSDADRAAFLAGLDEIAARDGDG